ncbi:MAG: hypothetical protein HWN65_23335 [Candidatus Helarchaeota archaeon]|nr:hypothetical protein [Candidatus Helarchaeota archaeon]
MLSLNGTWKAKPDNENVGEKKGYYELDYDDSDWAQIKVPGHWQEEGFPDHQGILWYRYKFDVSEQMKQFLKIIRLQFKGVFYYCTIWLNEEILGTHEGYFDVFDFNVTSFLDKENLLCVKVECMDEPDRSNKKQITGVFSDWDASDPSFNPGGIWGDVTLIETGTTYIKYTEIKSEIIDEKTANIFLRFEVVTEREGEKKFQLQIQPKNFQGSELKEEFYEKLKLGENEFTTELLIEDARLWWTHDHGYPYLYLLKITVFENEKVSDEQEQIFGIREFKRKIKKRSWEFYLNKKRIYLRGTNYAPCDHRIANITREDYERDVDLLVEGNFNMIRVHAHVDRIELHKVCAEKGVLIWQDFALQWGYSLKIKENAKIQAKQMARKIQNYPSQGVYCCHNEPFIGMSPKPIIILGASLVLCFILSQLVNSFQNAVLWGLLILIALPLGLLPTSLFVYNKNKDVLDKHLVEAILEVDDSVPVVPNSGIMGLIRMGTDLHTYEGWYWGKGYRDAYGYTHFPFKRMVCFITEYGAQAFPNLENLKKFVNEKDLWPINWQLLKNKHRCQPMFFERWFNFGQYKNISEVIDATQEYQAELLKFYNELWRINRYNPNGGTLMFLFNDCFPGITWSIVDYWRTPKKGYYATQLSFEPVLAMVDWPKRSYKPNKVYKTRIYVVNDLHRVISNASIKWKILNNHEEVVSSGDFTTNLEEDSIQTLGKIKYQFPKDAGGTYELELLLEFEETSIKNTYSLKIK